MIYQFLGFPHGPEGIEEMMRQYHLSAQWISNFVQGRLGILYEIP